MTVAYIPLNETDFALVNLDDVPRIFDVSLYWYKNSKGYAVYTAKQRGKYVSCHQMHRIVSNTPEELETDHINHTRLDNRAQNLRIVTNTLNQANKRKVRTWGQRPSKYKGLSSKGQGWRVYCKGQYLGFEKDEVLAGLMYNAAAFNLWGQHACLNDITIFSLDPSLPPQ
jgi:hypothetical protein